MTAGEAFADVRGGLADSRMGRGAVVGVVLLALIAAMDGYDVQAMSFVAPVIAKAWHVDKASLGLVLSCSLFGMAGGALGLSALADIFGRRPMILVGLVLASLGSLLSGLSHTVPVLALTRVLTGLGIGVMVALTTTLAAEFANEKRRGLAVAATTVMFLVGGAIGGLIAAFILRGHHPWQWVFGCGAIFGAILFLVVLVWLPESPAYIMDRAPPDALRKLNVVLARLGRPPLATLPPLAERRRASYRALFAPGMASITLRFALVSILVVTSAYYMLSWLPQLVTEAGFSPSTASLVTVAPSLIGVISGLTFGALAPRLGAKRLTSLAMIGFGCGLVFLGYVPPQLAMLVLAAGICGLFLSASTAVFYTTVTGSFAPLMRVSGMGFVSGMGRVASGAGPGLAGLMFAAGMTRGPVSLVYGAAAVLGGLILATIPSRPLAAQD
jgi:MFS family permease